MALGTIDTLAQKGSKYSTGQFFLFQLSHHQRGSDEVGRRTSRPQPPIGNHFADYVVIRSIFSERLRQPFHESITSIDNKIAAIHTDITAC